VIFDPGETNAFITVTIRGDAQSEPYEFVLISFHATNPDVTIGRPFGLGVIEIADDD
jgi:hypothetical protein